MDEPLHERLANLRQGADMLASLPLDLVEAEARVRESFPILQSCYDDIGRAVEEVSKIM